MWQFSAEKWANNEKLQKFMWTNILTVRNCFAFYDEPSTMSTGDFSACLTHRCWWRWRWWWRLEWHRSWVTARCLSCLHYARQLFSAKYGKCISFLLQWQWHSSNIDMLFGLFSLSLSRSLTRHFGFLQSDQMSPWCLIMLHSVSFLVLSLPRCCPERREFYIFR